MYYLLANDGKLIHPEDAGGRILVVDIGYYTCDLLVLDGMEIGKQSHSPQGLGIDTAYQMMMRELRGISRSDLDRMLLQGRYQDIRNKAFRALAAQISMEIDSLNLSPDRYIITGGWAPQISEYLTIPKSKAIVLDGLANVRGYQKIGVRLWGQSASASVPIKTMI